MPTDYPTHWRMLPLYEMVEKFLNGGTPSTAVPEYWDGTIPWITGADAEQRVTTTARKHITKRGVRESSTNIVPKGSILLVTRTGVGKVSISGVDVAISQDLTGVIPNHEHVDVDYLYRQLKYLGPELQRLSQGSIILGIQREEVEALEIPLPHLTEQRRIAEILDTADEAIRQTERLIAKLKLVKAGLLHDLLTRGLDEHGRLRDPQSYPEQFKNSPFGRIPREWQITTLGDVISKSGGLIQTGPFGSQLHAEEYTKEGIPVIMPQDIQGSHISIKLIARIPPQKAEALSRHRVAPNDVVFARRGDLSRCAPIGKREESWLCGTGCLLVRPPTRVINGRWLAAIYQHDQCQRQIAARAVGSTMVNLNTSLLSSLVIAKPSYDEQVSIVEAINAHGDRIRAEEAALGKLRQVKRGLVDDLLTGRVRV